MTTVITTLMALMGGLVLGGAMSWASESTACPYGEWLGQTCWVHPLGVGEWREHVIVAVSWKGAVCVKRSDALDQDGYWIKHYNVPKRVRFERPEVDVED